MGHSLEYLIFSYSSEYQEIEQYCMPQDIVNEIRHAPRTPPPLCLTFPEARETTTFGNPTFQAGAKTFAVLDFYKGTRCLAFKVTPEEQVLLCQYERFFVAPYTGKNDRLVALKRMLAVLDGVPALTRRRATR